MPEDVGYSSDFADDIAELMQRGMNNDPDAQASFMKLVEKADSGDERVAGFIQDAAARLQSGRHPGGDPGLDSNSLFSRLGELTGDNMGNGMNQDMGGEPTEREARLLNIIRSLVGQIKELSPQQAPESVPGGNDSLPVDAGVEINAP